MLNNLFTYTIPFFILIGILVAIHEAGHFFAARMLGIKVTDFAIGMGPTILKRVDKRNCTWRLCAFPIGGYVKMFGDQDIASSPSPDQHLDASESLKKQMFHLRPVSHRAIVIAAGPLVNLIFGFLLIGSIYMFVGRTVTPPIVQEVMAGYPAEAAGIKPMDRIVSADGHPIQRFEDLVKYVALRSGTSVDFVIQRGDQKIETKIFPRADEQETIVGKAMVGKIGIRSTNEKVIESISPSQAFTEGGKDVWQMTLATYKGIWETFTLQRPLKDMGGPVKIAEVSGNAWVKYGLLAFLTLMAAVSINLAIVNLLPLPVLDGGHLLLYLIEALQGRAVSVKVTNALFKASAVLLMIFLAIVTYSDISGIVHRLSNN